MIFPFLVLVLSNECDNRNAYINGITVIGDNTRMDNLMCCDGYSSEDTVEWDFAGSRDVDSGATFRIAELPRYCPSTSTCLDRSFTVVCTMREVITLQFGQLANHVGTHFWNTQVSARVKAFHFHSIDISLHRRSISTIPLIPTMTFHPINWTTTYFIGQVYRLQ